jgi:hypothetical protein
VFGENVTKWRAGSRTIKNGGKSLSHEYFLFRFVCKGVHGEIPANEMGPLPSPPPRNGIRGNRLQYMNVLKLHHNNLIGHHFTFIT